MVNTYKAIYYPIGSSDKRVEFIGADSITNALQKLRDDSLVNEVAELETAEDITIPAALLPVIVDGLRVGADAYAFNGDTDRADTIIEVVEQIEAGEFPEERR